MNPIGDGIDVWHLAFWIGVFYGGFFFLVFWGRELFSFLRFPVHVYRYRNPYDRKCVHCGYHENMFETIGGLRWEEMDSGHAGHRCSQKDAKKG